MSTPGTGPGPESGRDPGNEAVAADAASDDLDDTDEVTRLRRRGEVTGAASNSWAGSTMIARRESRRRSARAGESAASPAPADPLDGLPVASVRSAVEPATPGADAVHDAAYPARAAEAVIVPRRPATPRTHAGSADAAASLSAEVPALAPHGQAARRLAARRLLSVLGGGAAMVVVGIVLLALLLSVR